MTIFFDDLDTDPNSTPAVKAAEIRANAHIVNGGEASFPCPQCNGRGHWRPGYPCFKCKATGKISKGQVAAAKAKETRLSNEAQWMQDHQAEIEFLLAHQGWSDFYRSLYSQFCERRKLSDNQIASVRRGMLKQEERKEARVAEREAAKPVVDISAIEALFATATNNAVKKPIFRTTELTLTKAPEHGRNAGALYVTRTDDKEYLGKIVGGKFSASRSADAGTVDALLAVAADPSAEAIKYARKFNSCSCCGRTLRNPVSVIAVIGPICAEKWQLTGLREQAEEEYARLKAEEASKEAP
jgi:Family of unknown function (DUF6011)